LSPETGDVAHLVGQDELGAWRRSAYAGSLAARIDEPVDQAECRNCHMPLEDAWHDDAAAKQGKIRSHRFAGAHTWLAAMRSDAEQLHAERAMLSRAATIDIAAVVSADGTRTLPADGAPVKVGETLIFEVVIRNEGVGHHFPGGVLDAQDTWIELAVRDARGKLLAEAGAQQQASGEDATAHRLRALQVAYNHTIAPRDAEVVRYRMAAPPIVAGLPWRVTASLRHRSRDLALARAVCADAPTARGAAFAREVASRTDGPLDPCEPEPITDIAQGEVWIGAGSEGKAPSQVMPAWRRLFDHGLGLLSALQEDIDSARASLMRALELAPPNADRPRAMIAHALAQVAMREGRTEEALQHLDEAERLALGEPAIAYTRGQVLGNVWRWRESIGPLEQAARASPLDDALWSRLAIARASANDPLDALEATTHGLELTPRDADMLRVQALALERLAALPDDTRRARAAFGLWRPPDQAPAMKQACSNRFAWCALERLPVHVHEMRMTR
jgi:tetratricopeptide (TPR) repeat protein